jgi:sugar transferase (PEP-CTERM/EpsH1 system associated)
MSPACLAQAGGGLGPASPMNILFVVPYVPDRIRSRPYNLIRFLRSRGHRVAVVTLWTSPWERDSVTSLREEGIEVHAVRLSPSRSMWNSLKALPSKTPLQAVYCWDPGVPKILAGLLSGQGGRPPFDVVHVEHLRGAGYGLWLKRWMAREGRTVPVVWDSVDCISLLFRLAARDSRSVFGRWVGRIEVGRTEAFEGRMVHAFDRVLATSRVDAQALHALDGDGGRASPITVLTNGVDLDYFSPAEASQRLPFRLVMSGKMSYHANVTMALEFTQQTFPLVQARFPQAELWIVGKDPTREVMSLHRPPAVQVVGTVPDLRPYLGQASAAVAPLRYGAGVQNKVIEAMACATPVVVSPSGVQGLAIEPGREAIVAEPGEQMAEAVVAILADEERRQRIGTAGRRYVEQHHDWSKIVAQLEGVYDELVRTRH